MITSQQIAWAAGIFEGEGSCGWTSRHKNCQEVMVLQKDPWILYELARVFGFGKVSARKNYGPIGNGDYRWRISGPNARGFLMTIYTFLSPRRREQVKNCGVFETYDGVNVRRQGFNRKEKIEYAQIES